MGRELCDDIADDILEVFTDPNDFGTTLIFVPAIGVEREIACVAELKSGVIKNDASHQSLQTVLVVYATRSATTGLGTPGIGDRIRRNGELWAFQSLTGDNGSSVVAQFVKVQITQHGKAPSNL